MGLLITAFIVVMGFLYLLFKLLSVNREAGERMKREAEHREMREREMRERLERVRRKRDPLLAAQDAVEQDPERAAKVVVTMMKEKK